MEEVKSMGAAQASGQVRRGRCFGCRPGRGEPKPGNDVFELADFVGKRGAFRRWVCVNCGRVNRKMRAS